jgi:hypothetical protein
MLYFGTLGSGPEDFDPWVTLGLFLGVLAPLSLVDRATSTGNDAFSQVLRALYLEGKFSNKCCSS